MSKITYEVFSPKVGIPVFSTSYRWIARLLAWWYNLDYEVKGVGWLYTIDTTCVEVEDIENLLKKYT